MEVMLPMLYSNKFPSYVLATGEHKGYRYYVVNMKGRHPGACIRVPHDEFLAGQDQDRLNQYIHVHGGFTYSNDWVHFAPYSKDWWYIGWDYGHCDDYSGCYEDEPEGSYLRNLKHWSTEEIVAECELCCEEVYRFHTEEENNWNV